MKIDINFSIFIKMLIKNTLSKISNKLNNKSASNKVNNKSVKTIYRNGQQIKTNNDDTIYLFNNKFKLDNFTYNCDGEIKNKKLVSSKFLKYFYINNKLIHLESPDIYLSEKNLKLSDSTVKKLNHNQMRKIFGIDEFDHNKNYFVDYSHSDECSLYYQNDVLYLGYTTDDIIKLKRKKNFVIAGVLLTALFLVINLN